jgi:hypothetical protein
MCSAFERPNSKWDTPLFPIKKNPLPVSRNELLWTLFFLYNLQTHLRTKAPTILKRGEGLIFFSYQKKKIPYAVKQNSCQTLGPASKRVLPDLLFFEFFFICHFQYIMIKAVHRFTQKHHKTHKKHPKTHHK